MPTTYRERLHVPLRWWVQATMFLATIWIAFTVALPMWLATAASAALLAGTFSLLAWIGSVSVQVEDGMLTAGTARIPLSLLGSAEALDKETTRRVLGVDADARAFLVTRPYLSRAVRVAVDDPADPTPYWVISSRHPRQLVAAIALGQDSAHAADGGGHRP